MSYLTSFRNARATEEASGRERERETKTHLRTATRSCDLRRPCIAGNRSGGRDRRHFYTRRRTSTVEIYGRASCRRFRRRCRPSGANPLPKIRSRFRKVEDRKRGSVPPSGRASVFSQLRSLNKKGLKRSGRRRIGECNAHVVALKRRIILKYCVRKIVDARMS